MLTTLLTLLAGTATAQTDLVCATPMGSGGPYCLDSAGSWNGFEGKDKAPVAGLRHVAMCGGKLALAGYQDVAIREADGWAKLDRRDKPPIEAFACDAKGVPMIGHREGISRFQNGQWVDTANAALGVENATLDHARGFVVGADGAT